MVLRSIATRSNIHRRFAGGIPPGGITVTRNGALPLIQLAGNTVSASVKETINVPGRNGVARYVCKSISISLFVLWLGISNQRSAAN